MTAFQGCRGLAWRVTRPETLGAHAVALTDAGEVILVRLTYRQGWRLPGGGVKTGEDPRAAALRELSEEIGMTEHGAVEWVGELRHRPDFRRGTAQLFRVRGVRFTPPRWSIEVEEARAFAPDTLPSGLPEITARQLRMAGVLPEG